MEVRLLDHAFLERDGAGERGREAVADTGLHLHGDDVRVDRQAAIDRADHALDLFRRVKFDLVGLPLTLDEIAAIERDGSPTAYEQFVDELLASHHYGERWARHWLDLVRYAESVDLNSYVLRDAWHRVDDFFEANLRQ